jgi:hypothetical protein
VSVPFNYNNPEKFLGRLFKNINAKNINNTTEVSSIKSEYYNNRDYIYYDMTSFALAA